MSIEDDVRSAWNLGQTKQYLERSRQMTTENEFCTWKEDYYGAWDTTCDNSFVTEEGTPSENGFRYCTYCGRVLQEVPYNIEETTKENTSWPFIANHWKELYEKAAAEIERLKASPVTYIVNDANGQPTVDTLPPQIADRPHFNSEVVFVTAVSNVNNNQRVVDMCFYDHLKGLWRDRDGNTYLLDVIAWQPLPDPAPYEG